MKTLFLIVITSCFVLGNALAQKTPSPSNNKQGSSSSTQNNGDKLPPVQQTGNTSSWGGSNNGGSKPSSNSSSTTSSNSGSWSNNNSGWGNNNDGGGKPLSNSSSTTSNSSGSWSNNNSGWGNNNKESENSSMGNEESNSKRGNNNRTNSNSANTIFHWNVPQGFLNNRNCQLSWSCYGSLLSSVRNNRTITEREFVERLAGAYPISFARRMPLHYNSISTMAQLSGFQFRYIENIQTTEAFNSLLTIARGTSNPILLLTIPPNPDVSQTAMMIFGIAGSGTINDTLFSVFVNNEFTRAPGFFQEITSGIGPNPVVILY